MTASHDPGRTAYEARHAGETLGSRGTAPAWDTLSADQRAIWRRVEEACVIPATPPPGLTAEAVARITYRVGRKVPRNVYCNDEVLFAARDSAEAAETVKRLNAGVAALASSGAGVVSGAEGDIKAIADRVVQDVCELPDRTSPADWPEALLVTGDELHGLIVEALQDGHATPASVPSGHGAGQGGETSAAAHGSAGGDGLGGEQQQKLADTFKYCNKCPEFEREICQSRGCAWYKTYPRRLHRAGVSPHPDRDPPHDQAPLPTRGGER